MAERIEEEGGQFLLNPLFGGVDPDVALRSMELFADKVLPSLDVAPPRLDHRLVSQPS